MKGSQYFFLLAAVYVAPNLPERLRSALGVAAVAAAFYASYKGV